jgi:glutamate synthase domain-containing protein 2
MEIASLKGSFSVNFEKIAGVFNSVLPLIFLFFFWMGYYESFFFHFLTVTFFFLNLLNFYFLKIQKKHALLSNYGLIAQARYLLESIGPEFRQYLFSSDIEEKPFNRIERAEVYRKSKGTDSSSAYGSLLTFNNQEIKLRHSLYPNANKDLNPYRLVFGEERGIKNTYTLKHPVMISAMSFGALGSNAVRALARGAKKAGTLMNTGEGGWPKYHLMEGCDLTFQMGTAKFGVRNDDSTLNDDKLRKLAQLEQIKMIEIKLSQGAKPGKGGLLPKEKITKEISDLRGVPMGKDVVSPPFHTECTSSTELIKFIRRVQDVSELPVGIKFCLGRETEFIQLVQEMKKLNIFPDYITVDGAEGGTGAAPKSFMDDVGVPIFRALPFVQKVLIQEGVRNKLKLMAAGKLINVGRQFMAFSMGADAVYTARGFMLALGCIQALQCNKNTCPVGITTQNPKLEKGLDIEEKSHRVVNYIHALVHEQNEILSALGKNSIRELGPEFLYQEGVY